MTLTSWVCPFFIIIVIIIILFIFVSRRVILVEYYKKEGIWGFGREEGDGRYISLRGVMREKPRPLIGEISEQKLESL